jgi:type IV pilus assembly protein PilX
MNTKQTGRGKYPGGNPASQSGVVLVVSLIMLLLLMLMGAASVQSTSLEEKMAGNMRDKNLAFQAAESALKAAEASLDPPAALPVFSDAGTNGFYSETSTIPTAAAILTNAFWTAANPVATSTVSELGNDIVPPLYIIQKLPAACFAAACGSSPLPSLSTPYRITARATGGSINTVVILQSIYSPSP